MKIDVSVNTIEEIGLLEQFLIRSGYKADQDNEDFTSYAVNLIGIFDLLKDSIGYMVLTVDPKTRTFKIKTTGDGYNGRMYKYPSDESEILNRLNMPVYKSKKIVRESKGVINDFELWCESVNDIKEEKVLQAFDMDETLVYSYGFEPQVKHLLLEYLTPEDILNGEVNKIGTTIDKLKYENGRIYFEDPSAEVEIPVKSSWVRKKGRIYLTQPDSFLLTSHSHPVGVHKKMVKMYKEAENNAIITARYDSMRGEIETILQRLDIELPNFGLHMYPSKTKVFKAVWKSDVIIELMEKHGFTEVHYYDDNIKLLKKMRTYLADKNLNIHLYKVSNDTFRKL